MERPGMCSRRNFAKQLGVFVLSAQAFTLEKALGIEPQSGERLFFRTDGDGFSFDTGVLSGKLRPHGRPIGMAPLFYTNNSRDLAQAYGVCSHYRLLDADNRYGEAAWDWPGRASVSPDGSVRALWSRDESHPFDLQAIYRWTSPDTLDVTTVVVAARSLRRFEVFLASYFQGFADSFVYAQRSASDSEAAGFFKAERENGIWQMFPRDEAAIQTIRDGRWLRPPHPVDWAIMPFYKYPLAIRRDEETDLVAIFMSRPEDCFAVATPYSGESHRSIYFSLFGVDLEPEKSVEARVRMIIGRSLDEKKILQLYEAFVSESKAWYSR